LIRQGDSGDHRISPAYGLADSLEVPGDAACQFSGRLVEEENFFGRDRGQELLQ